MKQFLKSVSLVAILSLLNASWASVAVAEVYTLPPGQSLSASDLARLKAAERARQTSLTPDATPTPTEVPIPGATPPPPGLNPTFGIAPSAPPDEPPSAMEQFFARAPGQETANLRQFGYDFFAGEVAGAGVSSETTVPGTYPLGPGDELVLNVPFSTNEIRATVGRDGTLFIPNFGTLPVAGQTLDQFQAALRARARGSQVTVRLGKLRTLTVYLSGRVKRPGSYSVGALSTITTLLQTGGGALKNGSLRSVQLRRGDRTVVNFDFYDFLLKGKSSGNVRLEAGDVVFVPAAGPQVALAGSVRQPAIYEIKPGTALSEALDLAGGLLAQAYTQRVLLQRISAAASREVRTLDVSSPTGARFKLQDGDLVVVAGALDRVENGVTLKGNVERPGLYEIKPGDKVSSLIGPRTELKTETYFDYAEIRREVGPDRHLEIVAFDLGKALARDPKSDLALSPRDEVTIYALNNFQDVPLVKIYGAVLRPGEYRLFPNMRLSELIRQAGGLRPEADGSAGELTRTGVLDNRSHITRQNFAPIQALARDEQQDLVLAKDDTVLIKSVANYHRSWAIEISGEVANPGTYTILEGESLSNLIERAGGYTHRAYLPGAIFTRQAVKVQQQAQLKQLADRIDQTITAAAAVADEKKLAQLNSQRALSARFRDTEASGRIVITLDDPQAMRDRALDMTLADGDRLFIPPINETIAVLGAVYTPNSLRYESNWTVESYLRAAGGSTPQGDIENVYVVRANGEVNSIRNYREGWWIFTKGLLACTLRPGDAIVIPERIEGNNPWLDVAQIAQGVASVISAAALTYNAIKN